MRVFNEISVRYNFFRMQLPIIENYENILGGLI